MNKELTSPFAQIIDNKIYLFDERNLIPNKSETIILEDVVLKINKR